MLNFEQEIYFKTFRSGGKGGQNVNKVETAVEGIFDIRGSVMLTPYQKSLVTKKLAGRINKDGLLTIRSQKERSQLLNKKDVIFKINLLIGNALMTRKKRILTKPTIASKHERLQHKKQKSKIKKNRQKIVFPDN